MSSRLRSSSAVPFDYKSQCFICGMMVSTSDHDKCYEVRTFTIQNRLLDIADERDDDWGKDVAERIRAVIDLPAAEARYHLSCNINFRTVRQIPSKYAAAPTKTSKGRPLKRKSIGGRPVDDQKRDGFYKVHHTYFFLRILCYKYCDLKYIEVQ